MSNQLSNLSVITYNDTPVVTTELLAKLYGAEINSIQKNFSRNSSRFILGKHFFKLESIELKEFKNRLTDSQSVKKHTKSLIVWTERGAARHAKMLETDQAWEVFEKLEDCYFNQSINEVSAYREPLQIEVDCYNVNALANHLTVILNLFSDNLESALRLIDSPLAGKLVDRVHCSHRLTYQLKMSLHNQLPKGAVPRLL